MRVSSSGSNYDLLGPKKQAGADAEGASRAGASADNGGTPIGPVGDRMLADFRGRVAAASLGRSSAGSEGQGYRAEYMEYMSSGDGSLDPLG